MRRLFGFLGFRVLNLKHKTTESTGCFLFLFFTIAACYDVRFLDVLFLKIGKKQEGSYEPSRRRGGDGREKFGSLHVDERRGGLQTW